MGVIIPQVITEDKAGGGQIIEGSLRFNAGSGQYLTKTFSNAPTSTKIQTFSWWVKLLDFSNSLNFFPGPYGTNGSSEGGFSYRGTGDTYPQSIKWEVNNGSNNITTTQKLRDASSWYHIVAVYDISNSTSTERLKLYINGNRVNDFAASSFPATTIDSPLLGTGGASRIGSYTSGTNSAAALIAQVYGIDGQALDPSYFGYTDPLTNTWRPKKLSSSVAFGTNGFYLPLDGNTPIGQDQSGRGNNWTPVNFGGSNTIEKATGALPILNTDGGGKVARVGVRTDSYYANLKLAVPFVGVATDVVQQINGNSASMTSFTANNATFAVHPTAGAPYGTGLYLNSVSDYPNINYAAGTFNFLHNQTGSGTVEFWMYNGAFNTEAQAFGNLAGSPDVGFQLFMTSSTSIVSQIARGVSGSTRATGSASVPQNAWSHIAVTKTINGSNAELKLYVNGVLSASNTSIIASDLSNSNSTYSYFRIGQNIGDETGRGWTNYYMNDLRIYDTVKYTQNFIPASTDPDILPDTPSGVAYSSNVSLVPSTDGAVAFDGSGDYLSLTDTNNDLDLGGLQASVEFFVYVTDLSATRVILNKGGGASGSPWNTSDGLEWTFVYVSGGTFYFQYNNAGSTGSITSSLSLGVWTHVAAATDASNNISLFINGVRVGTATNAVTKPTSRTLVRIGQDWVSQTHSGHISNVHFVKGSGAYDPTATTITVPTGPITSVANTKLLCCQENKFPVVGYTTTTATGALPILNTNPTGTTTTGGVASDSSSSTIVLALSLLNNSSDSSATIKGSGSAKTFTATGNAAASSTQSKYYGGSFYFDGSGDSLTTTTSTDFAIKQSDFTIEMWVYPTTAKDGNVLLSLGTGMSALYWTFGINASNGFYFGSGTGAWQWETNGDPGTTKTSNGLVPTNTWTHIAAVRSGTSLLYFCNGLLVKTITSFPFGSATQGGTFYVGTYFADANNDGSWYQGYIQDIRIYKGTAKYTSNFNPVGNYDRPSAAVSPSQILPFGNALASNFNPFTVNINAVRGQESGYCTLNPLHKHSSTTLANGNLDITASDGSVWYKVVGTVGVSTGKWYWESGNERVGGSGSGLLGIAPDNAPVTNYVGYESNSYAYYNDNGSKYSNATGSSYGSTFTTGDVIGVALDMNIGTLTFYKNGVSQGTAFSGITGTYCPAFSSQVNYKFYTNFGQKPFKFPPPAGFQPLALANTPRPTIVRPDQYVGIVTYTGNGGTQSINVGWKPDLVWIKSRSDAQDNNLFDSVRGPSSNLYALQSNATSAEGQYNTFSSLNSRGFTLGPQAGALNGNGTTNVAWCWKAGGNSNTYNINDVGYATASAAGLTAGTITPTGASVNTKSGFSIITYTGTNADATISHGLGNIPAFIIAKSRNSSSWNWIVYHKSLGVSDYLALESTQGSDTRFANIWGTGHTTSVFGVKTGYSNNPNGVNMVAYCWAEIPGFSKFGSYTGNASSDGPVVVTGFRPRWLLIKKSSATGNARGWVLVDSERSKYNVSNLTLFPHAASAEDAGTYIAVDFLSNGFKLRSTEEAANQSYTYIYAAFAETPSFNLYGGQANAR